MSQSKLLVSFLIFVIFFTGLGIGFLLFQSLNETDLINPQRDTNKRYLSDELLLVGKDKEDKQFFIHLTLSRKQTAIGTFQHYYSYETVLGTKVQQEDFNKVAKGEALLSGGSVSSLVQTPAEDLSTRESYSFTITSEGKSYAIKTSQFVGDFVTKNSPDYTKYESVGKATVLVDGATFVVNALLSKIYAENYSTYVFFEGYDQLDSTTHLLALWDSADNFYFIDQSITKSVQQNYQSHTWVLHKNPILGMKKSYTAKIAHQSAPGNPKEWLVSLPEINDSQMDIKVAYYDEKRASGIVTGTITDTAGKRLLNGYAIYAVY